MKPADVVLLPIIGKWYDPKLLIGALERVARAHPGDTQLVLAVRIGDADRFYEMADLVDPSDGFMAAVRSVQAELRMAIAS